MTACYGINQTVSEKRKGVFRLNCLMRREGEYDETKVVYVAGSMPFAAPCLLSTF